MISISKKNCSRNEEESHQTISVFVLSRPTITLELWDLMVVVSLRVLKHQEWQPLQHRRGQVEASERAVAQLLEEAALAQGGR